MGDELLDYRVAGIMADDPRASPSTLPHPASNKSHARIHSLRPSPPFPADTKGGGISPESFRSPSSQSSEEDGILIPLWDLPLSSGVCGDVILGDESNAKLLGRGIGEVCVYGTLRQMEKRAPYRLVPSLEAVLDWQRIKKEVGGGAKFSKWKC
ncbi:hypothetical protein TNCV_5135591 [Trichonephila clavipes]|nr:hypothetical protein TNCV_5135591 [Trichonephila clavipes]